MSTKLKIFKRKELSQDAVIKGFTFLTEVENNKKQKKDFVAKVNDREYCAFYARRFSIAANKGYVLLDGTSNEYLTVKTYMPLVLTLLLFILLAFGLAFELSRPEQKLTQWIEEQGIPWAGNLPFNARKAEQEDIEIPGYSTLWVSEEYPTVQLVNMTDNTVYFKYELKIVGSEEAFYESDYLRPDSMIDADLKQYFDTPGNYDLTFIIHTYDMEDLTEYNGAVQSVTLQVLD